LNKLIYIAAISLNANAVLAAGGGHGSVTDLIFPAINAAIFFGFLVFKLKKPTAQMFEDSAKKIKEFNDLAEKKSKEAKIKLDMYQEKLSGLDKDVEKIKTETRQDAEKLKESLKKETQEKVERMNRDAQNKLESEKNAIVKSIYGELVDKVVVSAKEEIKKDSDKKSKATSKLLSQIN
jgi:F0F1-type ATP synthase membrane subunit b/b'